MVGDDIPDAVRRLIAERIDSIPELEAILLLRENSGRSWSATETGQRLYVSELVAAHILQTLHERGFLTNEDQLYRYAPESTELADSVTLLAKVYSVQLPGVTRIVHAKPSQSVRLFAQAFRLRKDE